MQNSTGNFAKFFNHGLKVVRSNGRVTVLVRSLNQNPTYYLQSNGRVLHVGGRKHIMRMFRRYVPVQQSVGKFLSA